MSLDGAFGSDPVAWFLDSFERARQRETFDATRAALATVDADGAPHVRYVLVRRVDARGFAFFTNLTSAKARQLNQVPRAALAFHWPSIGEQVRVEGAVELVADHEADEYFASRPRGSQLSAWASRQSRPIADRAALDAAFAEVSSRFAADASIPRPEFWGGYRVIPSRIEFWIDRSDRLHDRWSFTRDGLSWSSERLQP